MKEMRRILALVMCVVMLVGYMPVSAHADEGTDPALETAVEASVVPSEETTEPETVAVTGITLNPTELEVAVGEPNMALTVTVLPENATDKTVTWSSSNPEVVAVDEYGTMSFHKGGEAVITAAIGDFSATCNVTVVEAEPAAYVQSRANSTACLDAAIFCSDVHGSTSDLTSVLGGVKTSGVDYSSIGFVGDTCLTVANTTSIVQSALSDTDISVMFSYAASHDTEDGADISTNWNYSGEVEGVSNYYLVYTIRETDMETASGAATAAPAFTTWYNGLTDAQKKLPIFIMSHRPLHDRRDDNAGAATWYSAISAAAESSDITFFWAHNHTSEANGEGQSTSTVDVDAYYVAKDGTESFTVYNGSTVIPNFTYMNAGYINANNQSPKRIGVATTVEIYANSLVFQDYNSSGAYSGTYAHNVTVTREFAAEEVTLKSIAISGDTEYFVGDELNLTVTATYSNNTTADVTADATLSGYDMNTAGTQTVTATYDGLEATISITVTPIQINSIAVTTQPTKVSYLTGEELDTTGMVVTATYNNGTTAEVTGWYTSNVDMTTAGQKEVTVNYVVDGITYQTTFTITVEQGVAEGVTLESIEITQDPDKTEYLISQELVLDGMIVVATFSDGSTVELAYKPFSTSTVYGGYELDNFSMYVEKAHEVKVSYTFGDVTCYDTTTINVWNEDFTDENTSVKVHVAEGDYGVTDVNVVFPSVNTNVSTAVANVISGTNYVAYDITLALDTEGSYALTDGVKTVTLPIPSGVNNPVVYYVSDDGTKVDNMNAVKDGNGNVTFETTHFSTYVIGESAEIEVPENETASGGTSSTEEKEVYVLVSTPTADNQYIIVNSASAGTGYALKENTTTGTSVTINAASGSITAPYIETSDTTIMWNATSGMKFQSENGSYYLRQSNSGGSRSLSFSTSQSTNWTVSANTLSYEGQRNTYYVSGGSNWSLSGSSANVYFYEKQTVTVSISTKGTYSIEGKDVSVAVSKDSTANLTSTLTFTPTDGTATTEDVSKTATYEIVTVDANGNTVDGDPNGIIEKIENGVVTFTGNYGTALVKVSYTTDFGVVTDYITIEATAPYYSIDLCKPVTDADGNTTYESITAPIALKNIKTGDTYSVWAVIKEHNSENPEGEDLGDVEDDRIYWTVSDQAIATIDSATGVISFTGIYYGTITVTAHYLDENGEILCSDSIIISVSATSATVPGDGTDDFPEYPNEGAVRHDKTATAVGNFSETGVAKVELSMTGVPFTTGSEIDVVVMLDMTGSMSDDGMEAAEEATKAFVKEIVVNEDGSYNDNRVAVYAFNSGSSSPYELVALTTIKSDSALETANTAIDTASDKQTSGGTPFDEAAQKCQSVLAAAKTDGTGNDRQQFCVFMSDGGPTSYEGSDGYTYYGGNNTSGDRAITSYIGGYTSSTASDWSYNLPTEYYTDLMKADGVTVYTVGLLLQNAPSSPAPYSSMTDSTYDSTTDSLTSIGSHYYFTSTILKNMATDSSKYIDIFNVDNADKATAAFESIAKDILAAATDVTVADKIGTNYTMVFDAPNSIVDEADGGQEYYIEVTDYPLNPVYAADGTTIVDYTRGTGTSLLKLYFGYDATTGYYAATDANGTKAETPTFDTVTLGDKGTKYYWTTVAADGDSDISVVGADGTTYYFVSTGDGTHNMTAGAYASGTNTTVTLTHEDGTTSTSSTCQNMIIATPYFVYNAATKMLIWTLEEISANEVTLTYFLYLNNSGGFSGTEQEIAPETYKTNQFAYVDYTNFQNNECRLEFPVPQMTWNGAQVSYVFYLVNEAGQPVNRAGRVVPFSEAVYVTDVYTHAIVWNDLEQSAGLEAQRLAADLVPEVYALYDQGAEYNIHVYEDEGEVNLNNHFIITSSVDSDDSTTNNGVYTTYVFNTKADAHKYNVPGTYVVDNGNNTAYESGQTYLCKSYDVTGTFEKTEHYDELYGTYYTYTVNSADYTGSETQAPVSDMGSTTGGTVIGNYVYYVDENEEIYTIVLKNDGNEVQAGFDFSNTTVAFAVLWKPELVEDVVVVDYGLDVVIDVTTNDALASGVVGVRTDKPDAAINSGVITAKKEKTVKLSIDANHDENGLKELEIGTASVASLTSIRFSLDKTNGMQFSDPATFYYESEVNYYKNGELQKDSMYSSVTVIPATTVYYEDEYVTLKTFTKGDDGEYAETTGWDTKSVAASAVQAVDRPGVSKISEAYDADNVYGYDAAYAEMSTYSMNNSAKVNVTTGKYATAEFDFYGTGFDVIGVTSSLTGTMTIKVTGATSKNLIVDTYYGYTQDEDGKWVVTENDPNALYQVPVMKVEDLPYGKYHVVITATYNTYFDNTDAGSYDLYLDAIRIYDPTGVISGEVENTTVENAYVADNEGWPIYEELRNNIITAQSYDAATETGEDLEGAIFIDCTDDNYSIADYVSYGPNNELYLDEGQAIAFNVDLSAYDYINEDDEEDTYVADVQLGMKLGNGESVSYKIYDAQSTSASDAKTVELKSATDMYYSIMDYADGTVTIINTSGEILSLTNIKVTFKQNPAEIVSAASFMMINEETAGYALMSLRAPVVEEVPEETEPETTVPEETVPETTVPEETEPEETVPETTVPEETEPADPMEQIKETVQNIVNQIVNALSNLFSKWFR